MSLIFPMIASACLNAMATLCLRVAALQGGDATGGVVHFYRAVSSWHIGAVAFYSGAFVFYALSLRHVPPLSAYVSIVGCTVVLIALLSRFILSEPVGLLQLTGALVILAGIALVMV